MKAHLLFADDDFDPEAPEPPNAADLVSDLELSTLIRAMAGGDELVASVSRSVLLHPLSEPAEVVYRQRVLDDCLRHPDIVRVLYDLAGEVLVGERGIFRGFLAEQPESLLRSSIQALRLFLGALKTLRRTVRQSADNVRSDGFRQFFSMITRELDDDYFAEIDAHLKQLRLRGGLPLSARLGPNGESVDLVLRRPEGNRLLDRVGPRKPAYSYTVPERDEAGHNALAEMRDRGLDDIANAAAQAVDHVRAFFTALRAELAFYLGCVNLREALAAREVRICFPIVTPVGSNVFNAEGLYDLCLQLRIDRPVVSNTFDADTMKLVMVTGANQGGKSTFLRSVGVAHLMGGAGMFVAAASLRMSARTSVATHFTREEDRTMTSGKFDEELARMSRLANTLTPGALLLCNESFQSTNEREGSEIGRHIVDAMTAAGITLVFVTHLYDLAAGLHAERDDIPALFLRAERGDEGRRPFRLVAAEPLRTSYGQDVYDRVFGAGSDAGPTPPGPE